MGSEIHPTAIVEKGAKLGTEVQIGAYCVIGPDVEIGDRTKLGPHVVLDGKTSLGPENVLSAFTSIGGPPQDLKYHGEESTVVIGARNTIREYVTVHRGTGHGRMSTVIGNGNLLMANSHVAHDCILGNENVFANSAALGGHVTVGNRVILGGMVGVHQFCRIGDFAILGAGSMVSADVPPYCIGQGDRCHLRGINIIALQRAGFSKGAISDVRKVYRSLFSTVGGLKEKAVAIPDDLANSPHVRRLLDFLEESERGICTPAKNLSVQ